ncbi:MAG: protein kinase [Microcoleaceae cyanobacterium]
MSYCLNPNCPNPTDPSNAGRKICPQCGSELFLRGRYRALKQLGGGGFGKTFEIADEKEKANKVLKVLLKEHPKAVALFKQEAKVLSEIRHPGVPHVDADGYFTFKPKDAKDPIHCLVMEKIEGDNLQDWMKSRKKEPITQETALEWLVQLSEILDKVHSLNYFHRDIKPQNIMRKPNGQLVLIDFGTAREVSGTYLAKVEQGQNVTGIVSPGYTPPEQTNGKAVPQSDFFALGRTFVYLLTGKPPTAYPENPRTGKLLWRKGAPEVSKQLADVIDYLMAPFPGNRPQNPQVVLQCLREVDLSQAKPPVPTKKPKDKPRRPADSREILPTNTKNLSTRSRRSVTFPIKPILTLGTLLLVGTGIYTQVDGYLRYGLVPADPVLILRSLPGGIWLRWHAQALGQVSAVDLTPDNQILTAGTTSGAVRMWDMPTREQKFNDGSSLGGAHITPIYALAISPDSQTLVTAGGGEEDAAIRLWDINTGVRRRTIERFTNSVNALAFNPNGTILAGGSSDDTVRLWNLEGGADQILTIPTGSRGVHAIAFSPDGQVVASGGQNGTIKLWSITGGNRRLTIGNDPATQHKGNINAIAYTPDGQVIASASEDGTVRLWDANDGRLLKIVLSSTQPIKSLAMSSDGQVLASGSDRIHLWKLTPDERQGRNVEELATFWGHAEPITSLTIGSDNQTLISGSLDRTIKVWQLPIKQP